MNQRERVARAMAFFEETDDSMLLHTLTREIAPRVKKLVGQMLSRGDEDTIPPPADLHAAREAAPREEALATLRATNDFALLQVMARSIGRRIEAVEIVASAEFPPGARVRVPVKVAFPPPSRLIEGVVEESGPTLRVLLENGETWEGPPSLAALRGQP